MKLYKVYKYLSFLNSSLGIYKLNSGNDFFFEPTPGYYGFICQGTTECLNEGIKIIANHIESKTSPIIEEWKNSANPIIKNDYDWTSNNDPAGLIRYNDSYHSRIEINVTNKHSPFIIGAILAHELTHHYLFSKNIYYDDENENEKLTDFATVFLGLGKLTLNGYAQINWTNNDKEYKYRVGYLNTSDLALCLHTICKFRSLELEELTYNLNENSIDMLNSTFEYFKQYELKRNLIGHYECQHCSSYTVFYLDESDEEIHCKKCGWEWNKIQKYAKKRRFYKNFNKKLRDIIKGNIYISK